MQASLNHTDEGKIGTCQVMTSYMLNQPLPSFVGSARKRVVVVTGVSDSGKDTIGIYLRDLKQFPIIKFVEPAKRYVETCMNLPVGFMEDKVLRNQPVVCPITGMLEDYTYLDILIKMYHERFAACPKMSLPYTGNQISKSWSSVVLTDLRSPLEAEYLNVKYADSLLHIRVEGRGEARSSDEHLITNTRLIPIDYTVDNSGNLRALRVQLHSIIDKENL